MADAAIGFGVCLLIAIKYPELFTAIKAWVISKVGGK